MTTEKLLSELKERRKVISEAINLIEHIASGDSEELKRDEIIANISKRKVKRAKWVFTKARREALKKAHRVRMHRKNKYSHLPKKRKFKTTAARIKHMENMRAAKHAKKVEAQMEKAFREHSGAPSL